MDSSDPEKSTGIAAQESAPAADLVAARSVVTELLAEADRLAKATHSDATRYAYARDWADFVSFCELLDLASLPAAPETVCAYVAMLRSERQLGRSTIHRRAAAIGYHHASTGSDPTQDRRVRQVLKGVRRTDRRPKVKAKALSTEQVAAMVRACDDSNRGLRDRAVLLVGFACGLRRSEVCAVELGDIAKHHRGLTIDVRYSKTDQEGVGRTVAVPFGRRADTCPVRALREWVAVAEIADGAVFRRIRRGDCITDEALTPQSVSLIVKARAAEAGLPDSRSFSAHSLRSGFATTAARAGASERAIAAQTGHRSPAVLRGYIERAGAFDDNAVDALGL
jgi:integrase